MVQMDEAFLKKLMAAFAIEAQEHLEEINKGLRELKSADPETRAQWLETVFRETHSLKGAARAVSKMAIETICQSVESLFARLQKEQTAPSDEIRDVLLKAMDLVAAELENPETCTKEMVDEILLELAAAEKNMPVHQQPESKKAPPMATEVPEQVTSAPPPPAQTPFPRKQDTLRVSQERLDQVMRESEEILAIKLRSEHRLSELSELSGKTVVWKKIWTEVSPLLRQLSQATEKPESPGEKHLHDLTHKLRQHLDQIKEEIDALDLQMGLVCTNARKDTSTITRFVDSLHDNMRELLMAPFSNSLTMMHKVVRDLSVEQNKQVDLVISGGEIEADRRILEGIKDPLLHLIRNSIDHGIETPQERIKLNKPERGTVSISIEQIDSGKVNITIEDDGRGLDLDRIRQTLKERQAFPAEVIETMDPAQIASSIFLSGFSTAKKVTEISGRGIGMSVVHERVESFGGRVSVQPRKPWGTTFSIVLPVAATTFRGILVRVGDRQFILPTPAIERMVRIPICDVKPVENRDTIPIDGHILPLEPLAGLLDLPTAGRNTDHNELLALIICVGNQRFALEVDDVLREQEVLVKPLGPQLARVRNISGVAILGTGELTPILNIHDLIKSSIKGGTRPAVTPPQTVIREKKRVMIAEDSITSRMLLKNVLESVGYQVETAVDGAAAFAALKNGNFNALVSDVDMPRMNGFVLTERVRNDKNLSAIPVILVTSLSSQEDKERGFEAGASAYIVKSSFDQSNLLAVLDRLLET